MLLIAEFKQYFFGTSIFITSMFLIMLVLVQRGRGGGLTGALGGAGGQSAFGTKAGDLFTRITIVVAAVWIILCAGAVFFLRDRDLPGSGLDARPPGSMTSTTAPLTDSSTDPLMGSSTTGPAENATTELAIPDTSPPAGVAPENGVAPESGAVAPPLELAPATDAAATEEAAVEDAAKNP